MKISFVGPGIMGFGMAVNLAKCQDRFDYKVFGRRPEVLAQLKKEGIVTTSNMDDVTACDYIFLCLPDTEVVKKVISDMLPKLRKGQIIIDCSTISYLAAQELGEKLANAGIDFMDCPVSGQHARAMDGTLTIMCGGRKNIFEKVKPLLDFMGTTVLHMGSYGCGQLTKMINNCALDICTASFCELMPLGVKLGLDAEKLGKVLTTGTGASHASISLIPKILEGDFAFGFTLEKAYKDMASMAEVCTKYKVPLPTLNGTMQTYQLALQNGNGDLYKGAMIKFYEKLLGVECRKK